MHEHMNIKFNNYCFAQRIWGIRRFNRWRWHVFSFDGNLCRGIGC